MCFYFQEPQGNLGSETEGCSTNFIYILLKNVFRRLTCPLFIAGLSAQEKCPEASPTGRSLVQIPRSKQAPDPPCTQQCRVQEALEGCQLLVPSECEAAGWGFEQR